jgi:hypothetical protein
MVKLVNTTAPKRLGLADTDLRSSSNAPFHPWNALTRPPASGERTIIPGRNWGLVVVGRRGIFSGYLDGRKKPQSRHAGLGHNQCELFCSDSERIMA